MHSLVRLFARWESSLACSLAPDFAACAVPRDLAFATVETFLKKTPASYPIVLDTRWDAAKLFHVNVIPTYILIDPDGKIVDGQAGYLKAGPSPGSGYFASPDGQRFLINKITKEASPITILLNWKPPTK